MKYKILKYLELKKVKKQNIKKGWVMEERKKKCKKKGI